MTFYKTLIKRRSIRRFKDIPVPYAVLERCVNAARLAPSAANLQPLEYIVVDEGQLLDEVFKTLKWANYISPSGNPPPGERPRAYIVVLNNSNVRADGFEYDVGLAVGTIISVALGEGLGTCCIGSIDRAKLMEILKDPDHYTIALVVALGYPNESPITVDFEGSIEYWKDERNVLHVPKRKLGDILHRNGFASS
jgi:nitroreductase